MTMNILRRAAWVLGLAVQVSAANPLRPPAVPLVTHDPYFSIWSPADRLFDEDTMHWTGHAHPLTCVVRVDGQSYRMMGKEPGALSGLAQTDLQIWPTRTQYTFEGGGLEWKLTFMQPALPDDLDLLSRPATYLTWEMRALDGQEHQVAIFFTAGGEIAVNEAEQRVKTSCIQSTNHGVSLSIRSVDQEILGRKGDDLRIDWGSFFVRVPPQPGTSGGRLARQDVGSSGVLDKWLPGNKEESQSANEAAVGVRFDCEKVGAEPEKRWLALIYAEGAAIRYMRRNLRPYYTARGWTAAEASLQPERLAAANSNTNRYACDSYLLSVVVRQYELLVEKCRSFDEALMADLRHAGGEEYAQLAALAYRQTLAGNKLVADAQKQPLMFPKENFSNGCIGTVDVLFPQAPFYLLFSPALTKAMLVPILDYASSSRWPYPYAPHDLGTYPFATGQVYGMDGSDGDRMPVEESGNMLIMLAALAKVEGNADFARPYRPMLARWADYLAKEGLDPTNQLCSADMFGHLPRNANLALKAIIGLRAFGQLCAWGGQGEEAKRYESLAQDGARRWLDWAKDDGHTRLAYHLPGTWSMKHNLVWDRILASNLAGGAVGGPSQPLFPQETGDAEVAWYLKVQQPFGLPVDHRTDTSLIDWALWSITLARQPADFQALVHPIWKYVNETPSRVPLSDWYVTLDAKQKGFQARPVVGGIFIKMLADPVLWAKWARRGNGQTGPWAPLPVGGPLNVLSPTAEKETVMWRYTLEKPPEGWEQPDFDDSGWKEAPGGFGTKGTPGAVVRTEWNSPQIWLRRSFPLEANVWTEPCLRAHFDEDATVWLNGQQAARLRGWTTQYEERDMNSRAKLHKGRNVLAVHCQQTYGGQYIDVGVLAEDARGPQVEAGQP